ncbi:MAG: hypothetical protein LBF79_03695 [Dysgonamonadaceae bacterium]|nr:hypothetical protein [Dysgonamonadaceae bacterium]
MFSCALINSSCGEPLMDYDIDTETPVVESYFHEGANSLTMRVYTMEVYLKDEYDLSDPIGGLAVKVNDKVLTETSEGIYSLDLGEDTLRAIITSMFTVSDAIMPNCMNRSVRPIWQIP